MSTIDELDEMNQDLTPSLLEQLLEGATQGEEIIDEKVGKYDAARLTAVALTPTKAGDDSYLTLVWSGLTTVSGVAFEQTDRLFFPKEDTHPIGKSRFMRKLKMLGVIPVEFKNVIYFNEDGKQKLVSLLEKKIGEEWPITISSRNDFYDVTVRQRPKLAA